jgi:16S rRNA (cytosine1402-N4)-methyltransferase
MHVPVLLQEVIDTLALAPGMSVIDCTVGGGGHTRAMLERIGSEGTLLGFDADETTLAETAQALTDYPNAQFAHAWFSDLETVAATHGFRAVDGILFDLGFSSLQLDNPERGLSFQADGPLDMRLNPEERVSAQEIINRSNERDLADIFYRYGELYDARRMAKTIVEARHKQAIERTSQLVEVLGLRNPGVKAKVFQALRIAVNQELPRLEQAIPQAVSLLKPGGRVAIITFHSLEDRIVKNAFRDNHLLELVTKKPIIPTDEEIATNSRSRSAKLRVAQKLAD